VRLYLIRHPAPDVAAGICYGGSDLPLAADVAAAAARIRPRLPPDLPLYTSPLQRCRQLADALHPAARSDERLREMSFGLWEMQAWDRIQREALDGWAADPLGYTPPEGESVGTLQQRVRDFIAEIQRQGIQSAVLVAHAGVMKVIVGRARRLPEQQWIGLRFDYESVVIVDLGDEETAA
jgi:alpha-ribazole phosphatase